MKPFFHTKLVNGPFDDPVLYVECMFQKRALLFDLGNIYKLSLRHTLKISHVFVTHTHMDHFIGFDHLIRLLLGRGQDLSLFGPPGIIESVRGKLSGYSWNLVENYRYPFLLNVFEINDGYLKKVELVCCKKFAPRLPPEKIEISDGFIHCEDQFTIRAVALDHKISSMAYLLEERFHLNVDKEKLKNMGLQVGPWLSTLKRLVYGSELDSCIVKVKANSKELDRELGELKNEILITTAGQKIGYIADCDFSSANREKIVSLMAGIDLLYIEASFLDKDKERARVTAHLTAREAGELARKAGVKKMKTLHFSPKYSGNQHLLIQEAQMAFQG